ncbi:peptidase [Serinibacter arcticus]|uniref:Peptidase n=1 Tax=Serinibacter arcticus TaxID=1655435 RepID=A0A2U1ZY60_9MICO|nr:peptidase [Serinibacter arcticus]PWD51927.1 peptidase [Serinibacter arcticus]
MKRSFAVGAAVLALVALPTAAQAYPAPPVPVSVSSLNPAPGEPVTVTAGGLETATVATMTVTSEDPSVPDATITIAGTASLTKDVPGSTVEFSVTHTVEGVYTHQITTDAGHDLPAQVVTVGTPSSGSGSGSGAGAGSGSSSGTGSDAGAAASAGGLAETGVGSVGGLALLAGGLVVAGAGGTYLVRRGTRTRA